MRLPRLATPDANVVHNFSLPVFWGATDNDEVAKCVRAVSDKLVSGIHFADNFLTWGRNNSMFDDGPFVAAWRENLDGDLINQAIVWRRYILACAGYHAVQLDGDFVECGCYKGTGVKTIVDYLGGKDFPKTFWAYDLFEHSDEELHHAMPGHGPNLYDQVCAKFEGYSCVRIIRGRIPEVLEGQSPARIAYLHIDMNQAPAEIAALDALFDRVVAGGIVVLDDYEWAMSYRGQKLAEDRWFDERSYRVFPLPTGQGIVLKR